MFTRIGGVLERITGGSSGSKDDSQPSKKLKVNDSPEEPHRLRHSLCRMLNESLYELHKPDGTVKMQVLFVHGLQLRNQSYSQTNYQSNHLHLSTWLSEDEQCVWPEAWLPNYFPDAQIFCLSYDGNIRKIGAFFGMRTLGESLLADLVGEGHIGQIPFCPVVLVGHSFGGLLIKQLCYEAFHTLPTRREQKAAYNRFLTNVKGIFYYATPHDGMQYADKLRNELYIDDELLSYLSTDSPRRERLNEDFDGICQVYSWLLCGVGETRPTKLDKNEHLLVKEASARRHYFNLIDGADHFSICRPANEGSRSFTALKRVLHQISATTEKEKEYGPGTRVGEIFASTIELGRGSNGTVVYKGYLRETESLSLVKPIPIAVKRLLFSHNKNAENEIEILIKCPHENVVRYYRKEETEFFTYLALERCSFSLDDLIRYQRPPMRLGVNNPTQTELDREIPTQKELQLRSEEGRYQRPPMRLGVNNPTQTELDREIPTQKELQLRSEEDWKLWCQWDQKWRPTPKLMKIMEDLIAGLKHLHGKNIAHRDLKPHNVLIKSGKELQAKIADMGHAKELDEAEVPLDKLTSHGSPVGSLGWQAPEKLIKERRHELAGKGYLAADIFSLGCVLYYCITGGEHPYGSEDKPGERERNIAKGNTENMKVEHESMSPEATDLVESLLDDVPCKRLRAQDILDHPFFWDAKKRLEFLRRASDKLKADKLGNPHIVAHVDSRLSIVNCGSWTRGVNAKLQVGPGGPGRKYNYQNTVFGLLRLIRNLKHHFPDNADFQTILGSDPDGIDEYFTVRFPRLLSEVYHVIGFHYKKDTSFQEYYPESYSYIPKFP